MFVFSTQAMGGMELRAARLARLTMEKGHSVWFGCPGGSQLDGLLKEYGVPRTSLHIHGSLDLLGARKLAAYLRKHRINLVMPFAGNDYWMTIFAGKASGARVVVNRSTPSLLNPLSIPVLRRADGIVAVSKGIEDILVGQGIPADQITVVYLGVDTRLFSSESTSPRAHAREALGLPVDKFIIGFLSRPGKGQEDLLQAGNRLASICPDMHYLFAGGDIPVNLGPVIEDFPDLQERITLRDRLPHGAMPDVLKALDVFVLLPETEPFSNAVLEAMAMEKPVVVTRTQGNIEAIEDGKSGLLVMPHDIATLVEHLGHLHDFPERRLAMGQHARQRVLRFFTQDIMMNRMQEVWISVMPKTQHGTM